MEDYLWDGEEQNLLGPGFVGKFYPFNKDTEEVLARGTHLRNGMVVLIEDEMLRGDLACAYSSAYDMNRILTANRWCTVTEVYINVPSDVVEFVAVYEDGDKRKRMYGASYAWLVKKDSLPKPELNITKSSKPSRRTFLQYMRGE